jgi:hypothetical protein
MTYTDREPDTEHGPELDATDARQGRWGRHMLWVLLAGLVLVVIALFGTWASRSGDLGAVDDKSRATAEEGPQTSSKLLPARQNDDTVRP